jgi:hypothetical protein
VSGSEQTAASLAGTVLEGAYRITRLLGEGGMGAVYEAVQLRLNKRVAVKVMSRELAANSEALARFHREAEITSLLGHAHLVTIIDFGMAQTGEPYLVMEYLDGEDLEHRIQRDGRLPIETAVQGGRPPRPETRQHLLVADGGRARLREGAGLRHLEDEGSAHEADPRAVHPGHAELHVSRTGDRHDR